MTTNPTTVPAPAPGQAGTTPPPRSEKLLISLGHLVQGVSAVIPAGSTLNVDGQALPKQQVLDTLNAYVELGTAAAQARTQYKADLAVWERQRAAARQYALALKATLLTLLGKNSPQLERFGFPLPKAKVKLTAAQLIARAAKAKATRALRGTKGPKARTVPQFKGTIEVSTQQQPTAAAAVATAAPVVTGGSNPPPAPPANTKA